MRIGWIVAALVLACGVGRAEFVLKDTAGQQMDVAMDGRIVARYVYAYDPSTPARRYATFKPYLHVFDAEGKAPITNDGDGGEYPHHRGIFIGCSKTVYGGKSYDWWGMRGGDMVHQKFLAQQAGADEASFTALVHWNDTDRKAVIVEQRTMTFRRCKCSARVVIDFAARLSPQGGDVVMEFDPEHAGVQYRAAEEMDRSKTTYVLPKEGADAKKDLDYPWVGMSYTLEGKRYSVVHMNHPANPKGSKYSAYRDYGRFGPSFKTEIKAGQELAIKYRFLVADGEMPGVELIQKCWDNFAAVTGSAAPKVTVTAAEARKVPAKKK